MHLGPKNENLSMSENDKIGSKQNQKNLNIITYWAQNDSKPNENYNNHENLLDHLQHQLGL